MCGSVEGWNTPRVPQNRDLVYRWMSTLNKSFDNLTPVDVVKEWGFAGLLMVRGYLDRARGV